MNLRKEISSALFAGENLKFFLLKIHGSNSGLKSGSNLMLSYSHFMVS